MPPLRRHLAVVTESDDDTVALFSAMAGSDREAFRRLAESLAPRLKAFCRRLLRSEAAADDAAQDVLVALWESRRRFAGADGTAWAFTVALNHCRKHVRGLRRFLSVTTAFGREALSESPADEQLVGAEDGRKVGELVRALPVGQREALWLRFDGQLDYRRIGEVLGCSEVAARARVYEGLKSLRQRWEGA
jgi:RNA polymerase sigma-70 factor, ECF subfamily